MVSHKWADLQSGRVDCVLPPSAFQGALQWTRTHFEYAALCSGRALQFLRRQPAPVQSLPGWSCAYDTLGVPNGVTGAYSDTDRLDLDITWLAAKVDLQSGLVDFVCARPPYATFAAGRHHASGPTLSGPWSTLTGFPGASCLHDRERERKCALALTTQTVATLQARRAAGVGFARFVLQPLPGPPSIFSLPEGVALLRLPGAYGHAGLWQVRGQGQAPRRGCSLSS